VNGSDQRKPNLVSGQRQKIQLELAFPEGNEGEALQNSGAGTESLAAMTNSNDPVKLVNLLEEMTSYTCHQNHLTSRTAVVRTRTPGGVGGGGPLPPIPIDDFIRLRLWKIRSKLMNLPTCMPPSPVLECHRDRRVSPRIKVVD